jgi:GDP-L-fucose synthase
MFWKNRRVLVTGGTGFIGSYVVEHLLHLGASVRVFDRIPDGKIRNIPHLDNDVEFIHGDCADLHAIECACAGQDVVMNLAAHVGGIEYNRMHQGLLLRDNLNIATTVIEGARRASVERFLVVSSACVYPHDCIVPTPESEGDRSVPEETNGGYGWAKRMAEKIGYYYANEYGMKVGVVRPYNTYGPRDHFGPENSHVIPALLERIMENENPLVVWGSGKQTRAFLYVEDVADGMIRAIERYPVPDPVNLGTDEEVTIAGLVQKITHYTKRNPTVVFDTSKPDGSPRRNSDNSKAKEKLGFKPSVSLDQGLKKTIDWYRAHHDLRRAKQRQ